MTQGEKAKLRLLQAGIRVWPDVTASNVARDAGFKSHKIVSYHFPGGIKDAVAQHAVETGNPHIIVQLIGMGHESVAGLSEAAKRRYIKSVSQQGRP